VQCARSRCVRFQARKRCKRSTRRKMLDKRQRNNSECEDSRLGRDLKKRLHLRMRRTSGKNYRKTTKLEMANIIFGSTIELQDVND
jgi:hypothetical protein